MNLKRRECPVKIRLEPYGAGWTDVYADFGDGELGFVISNTSDEGGSFQTLLRALYHLYPDLCDHEKAYDLIDYKYGLYTDPDHEDVVTCVRDELPDVDGWFFAREIPAKASFMWDEERWRYSNWILERNPDENVSFTLKVKIDICRNETEHYEYEVKYEDMCYAVADACTKMLKKHGFWGYHHSGYTPDMNVRYLLFLKSIALGNMEARELTFHDEIGQGETADFNKEIELLLFDM